MADKELKKERRMNRYTFYKIQRVDSYGYGPNDKYRNKPKAVCYWTKEGGCFVSYKVGKFGKLFRRIRWRFAYYYPQYIKEKVFGL